MATALLGPDRIRFTVNHLVGDAVGGAAQQAFDTHDIPHRGAQGAGAQEGIGRLGPAQPPNSLSAHYRTPDRHCRSRAASQAPSSLERGLRQLQAVAIAVGANFSLGDLHGRYCSARPAGWCEPWRDVLTMLARTIAKARAEQLSLAASNVEEVLACSAGSCSRFGVVRLLPARSTIGGVPGWSRPAPATSSKPLPSVHRGARR